MSSNEIIDLLSGKRVHITLSDISMHKKLGSKGRIAIDPISTSEPLKVGDIVAIAYERKIKLRNVAIIRGDSCQLVNDFNAIEGWFMHKALIGIVRPEGAEP